MFLYAVVTNRPMVKGIYTERETAIASCNEFGNYVIKFKANIVYDCLFDIDKHGTDWDNTVEVIYIIET